MSGDNFEEVHVLVPIGVEPSIITDRALFVAKIGNPVARVTGAGAGSRGQCRLAACPVVPQPQGALPVSGMPWGSDICPS
jgi:hypothetical protein